MQRGSYEAFPVPNAACSTVVLGGFCECGRFGIFVPLRCLQMGFSLVLHQLATLLQL